MHLLDYESDKQLYFACHSASQNLENSSHYTGPQPPPPLAAAATTPATNNGAPDLTANESLAYQERHEAVRGSSDNCSSARRRLLPFFTFTRRSQHPWWRRPRLFFTFSVRFPREAFVSVVTTTSPRGICFDAYRLYWPEHNEKGLES